MNIPAMLEKDFKELEKNIPKTYTITKAIESPITSLVSFSFFDKTLKRVTYKLGDACHANLCSFIKDYRPEGYFWSLFKKVRGAKQMEIDYLTFILDPIKSPWRNVVNNCLTDIDPKSVHAKGFIAFDKEDWFNKVTGSEVLNFLTATRFSTEYYGVFTAVWCKLVERGANPSLAFIVCQLVMEHEQDPKYINNAWPLRSYILGHCCLNLNFHCDIKEVVNNFVNGRVWERYLNIYKDRYKSSIILGKAESRGETTPCCVQWSVTDTYGGDRFLDKDAITLSSYLDDFKTKNKPVSEVTPFFSKAKKVDDNQNGRKYFTLDELYDLCGWLEKLLDKEETTNEKQRSQKRYRKLVVETSVL